VSKARRSCWCGESLPPSVEKASGASASKHHKLYMHPGCDTWSGMKNKINWIYNETSNATYSTSAFQCIIKMYNLRKWYIGLKWFY
jgi:hypothetical protein